MNLKSISYSLLFLLLAITVYSCSSGDDSEPEVSQNFTPKLVKQITDNEGFWTKFFYNSEGRTELITRTSNQVDLDSTYFFYNGSNLIRTYRRIYVPVTGIVNIEILYDQYNSDGTSGSGKIYLDDGTIFSDYTFVYDFDGGLIKSIKFYRLDGTLRQEKSYAHNAEGNLVTWTEIWYDSNNQIATLRENTINDWDTNGLVTENHFENIFEHRHENLNVSVSANNCLNRSYDGQLFRYSFEYDSDGNVTNYTAIDEQYSLDFEYYD